MRFVLIADDCFIPSFVGFFLLYIETIRNKEDNKIRAKCSGYYKKLLDFSMEMSRKNALHICVDHIGQMVSRSVILLL